MEKPEETELMVDVPIALLHEIYNLAKKLPLTETTHELLRLTVKLLKGNVPDA